MSEKKWWLGSKFFGESIRGHVVGRLEGQREKQETGAHSARAWNAVAWLVVAGLALFAAKLIWQRFAVGGTPEPLRVWTLPTEMERIEGLRTSPALSPDGKIVAASLADAFNEDLVHLHVRPIENGDWVKVTVSPARDLFPTWTPDGMHVGFVRQETSGSVAVYQIGLLGGKERRLLESYMDIAGFQWLPDETHLIMSERPSEKDPYAIYQVNLETRRRTQLSNPPHHSRGDFMPRVSPQGHRVAFVRQTATGEGSLMTLDLESGDVETATHPFRKVSGLTWKADGLALIFAALSGGKEILWEYSVSSGLKPFVAVQEEAQMPTGATREDRLVYSAPSAESWMELFSLEGYSRMRTFERWRLEPNLDHLTFAPNGQDFVTTQATQEGIQVLVRRMEDGNPLQRWLLEGQWASKPFWSPDGKSLVISVRSQDIQRVFQLSRGESEADLLWHSDADFLLAGWQGPGKALLISSPRESDWQIWEFRPDTPRWESKTPRGGLDGRYLPQGDGLVFTKRLDSGLWQVRDEGVEERLLTTLGRGALGPWTVHESGIFFLATTRHGTTLNFVDFIGKRVKSIAVLDSGSFEAVEVSPDGTLLMLKKVLPGKTQLKLLQAEPTPALR